jgi:hypothetical protein
VRASRGTFEVGSRLPIPRPTGIASGYIPTAQPSTISPTALDFSVFGLTRDAAGESGADGRGETVESFDEGLRCQDVHAGLRNVNPNSGALVPLAETQMIGMAASVAALIRGRDVVDDAQALRAVAAEQLDVNLHAFEQVVVALEDVGFVSGIQSSGGKITSFTENVPYYDDLYTRLGMAWRERAPSELEQQMVIVIDALAAAPIPLEELAARTRIDSSDMDTLMDVGQAAELVQTIDVDDGIVAYSPFFGFENPKLIGELIRDHGPGQLAAAFEAVTNEQGLPVTDAYPLLQDAVGRGLLAAPSVLLADGTLQPFATLPYSLDRELLHGAKPVLEKAMAVVACLRCAERFGGYSNLSRAGLVDVIDKLLDPNRGFLMPHSGHLRQYQLLNRAGLIKFGPDLRPGGNWVTPIFVDTEDNRRALRIARDLLSHGEQVQGRIGDDTARRTLELAQPYSAPMQTLKTMRRKVATNAKQWQAVVDRALGRSS